MIKVLTKVSLRYWGKHKQRLLTMALAIVMGVAALCCCALLVRSEKAAVLEEYLTYMGDYDLIFYESDMETLEKVSGVEGVTDCGYYHELGYAVQKGGKEYKVISFGDEKSEEMYHLTCIRGDYPKDETEVALDIETARSFGIAPYPGEQVELTLYDLKKEKLCSRTFTVSGIFELYNANTVGGYRRYPDGMNIKYIMPTVVLSVDLDGLFGSSIITGYAQVEDSSVTSAIREMNEDGTLWSIFDDSFKRGQAYSYVLGADMTIWNDYGDNSMGSVVQAVKDGNIFRDFYSSVLIPVFSFLVLVIVIISVMGLVRNVLKDRTEMTAVLRSVGLSAAGSGIYLTLELVLLAFLLSLVGLIVGMGCHAIIIGILNDVFHMQMAVGFAVDPYVKAITNSPYSMPLLVVGVGVAVAVLLPVSRITRLAPVMLFQGQLEKKKQRSKTIERRSGKVGKGWLPLIGESISLHDVSVMIMIAVVMGTAFFGYTYFKALSDKNTNSLQEDLESSGLGNRDYLAQKRTDIYMHSFKVENHHDCGVSLDAIKALGQEEYVESAYGMIVNQSTRLTFSTGTGSEAFHGLFSKGNLRISPPDENEEDEYAIAAYEGMESIIEAVGYTKEEDIYAAPTVGLSRELIESLEDCLVAGTLNWEQIAAGEEVVIAVPEEMADAAAEIFQAGESLPLSDVVLSEEEDLYDFGYILPEDVAEPVYSKVINIDGADVEYYGYAFGTRKDIRTSVGAVVAISKDEQAEDYHDFMGELLYEDLLEYPLLILCAEDAFQAWGLPDTLYTKVAVSVKDDADVAITDIGWYKALSQSTGMISQSVSQIKAQIQTGNTKVMSIYYVMIIMLVITGMTAIGISLYSRIRMSSTKIAHLRAIGMSLSQMVLLIIRQNAFYPVIGAVCAVIPAGLCQCFFYYTARQIDTGAWGSATGIYMGRLPWWFEVPYRYNLFAYHPVITLLVLALIMMGLIVLVTIPQILYIRKQRIVEDLEKVSF